MIEGWAAVFVKLWRRGFRWLGHKQRGEKHVNFGLELDNRRDIEELRPATVTVKQQGSLRSLSPQWGGEGPSG